MVSIEKGIPLQAKTEKKLLDKIDLIDMMTSCFKAVTG